MKPRKVEQPWAMRLKKIMKRRIPLTDWMMRYTREDAYGDVIAGVSIALTMVPQSIAYAALAGLDPQLACANIKYNSPSNKSFNRSNDESYVWSGETGISSCRCIAFVAAPAYLRFSYCYALLVVATRSNGTLKRYGLNSAFMGSFIYVFFGTTREVIVGPSSLMSVLTYQYTSHLNVDFVLLLTFLVGVVELLMALLNLGFLVNFISAPVVSGFTTAISLMVALAQLKGLFGLHFKAKGMFQTVRKIFENYDNIQMGDTVLGITCIVALLFLRKLKELKLSNKCKGQNVINKIFWFVSTARNAIVVVFTACISFHYFDNGLKPPFVTTKRVESGVPSMMLPPISTQIGNQTYELPDMIAELGASYVLIPMVSVLANIAIAKVFVNGVVDASQEMLALSVCNVAGSFFQSIPSCGAFSRSAVISASGVRTPLAGLYAAGVTFLALEFLSPYFYLIPRSTLAAVLIAAIMFLIDWEIFIPLRKAGANLEIAIVFMTGFVCLFVGVELGLLFGVMVTLSTLIYKWARPNITVTRCKTDWGEYISVKPEMSLYFPAVDYVSTYVVKLMDDEQDHKIPIVIDCKEIKGSDYTTAKGLDAMIKIFEKRGQTLLLQDVRAQCQKIWKTGGIKDSAFVLNENLLHRLYQNAGPENDIAVDIPNENRDEGDETRMTEVTVAGGAAAIQNENINQKQHHS